MKSLIKYQFVLLVTLIVGYGQLFAPLARIGTVIKQATLESYKSPVSNPAYGGVVYIEEECDNDNRFSRKLTELPDYILFFNNSPWEFITSPTVVSSIGNTILYPGWDHPAFRVLRL